MKIYAKSKFIAQRAGFYQDLAEAIDNRYSVADFLSDGAEYYASRGDSLAEIYSNLYESLSDIESNPRALLSIALEGAVPRGDMILLVALDNATDKAKSHGLKELAHRITTITRLGKTVRKGLMLPALVFPLIIAFLYMLAVYLVPSQIEFYPLHEWTGLQKSLYWVSYIFIKYWILELALVVAFAVGYSWTFNNFAGRWRNLVTRIWVLGIPYRLYRDFACANFVSGLARILETNSDLVSSLQKQTDGATPFLAWHIETICERLIATPNDIASAFDTGLFSDAALRRLHNYAKWNGNNFVSGISRLGNEGMDKLEEEVGMSSLKLNIAVVVLGFLLVAYTYGTYLYITYSTQRYMKEQSTMQELDFSS